MVAVDVVLLTYVRCVYSSLLGFGLQFLLLLHVVSSTIVYGVVFFVVPHVMWILPCSLLLVCCLDLTGPQHIFPYCGFETLFAVCDEISELAVDIQLVSAE